MAKPIQIFNYQVTNKADSVLDLHIDGVIIDSETQDYIERYVENPSSTSYKSLRNKVLEADPSTINLYLNGPGGDVGEALAAHDFFNELESKGVTINRIGRGVIGSACTYLLVGNNSEMSANSTLMIHNISMYAGGNINEIESAAKMGRMYNDLITNLYADKTGQPKETIAEWMNAETYMTADDAQKKGFVNKVTPKVKFKNSIKPENWLFKDKAILNAYNGDVQTIAEPPSILEQIKNEFMDFKKIFNDAVDKIRGIKPAEGAASNDIANSIAAAITEPFAAIAAGIPETISEGVKPVSDALTLTNTALTALTTKVDAQAAAITALEATNAALQTQLLNRTGHQHQPAAGAEVIDMEGATFHNIRKN